MGFFRKMFGKDDTAEQMVGSTAPASDATLGTVHYDPKLVDSLLGDHSRLGNMYSRIGMLAKNGEFAEVRTLLAHFKSSLQAHILTENVRFYSYLEKSMAGDSENARTIHEFRRDMNTIAREVVNFVKTWQNSQFTTAAERQQFGADYDKIGELLEQRLDSEENSLYPLYMAP
ncbi:MAG TPA: hemerythrin domain-containing protein [Rhodanobacteraceae bacterium]